jgi:hypothetical protein
MPYKSKAQAAYFNIHRKELERQGVDVDEWNESSRGEKLPKKVKKADVNDTITGLLDLLRAQRHQEQKNKKYPGFLNFDPEKHNNPPRLSNTEIEKIVNNYLPSNEELDFGDKVVSGVGGLFGGALGGMIGHGTTSPSASKLMKILKPLGYGAGGILAGGGAAYGLNRLSTRNYRKLSPEQKRQQVKEYIAAQEEKDNHPVAKILRDKQKAEELSLIGGILGGGANYLSGKAMMLGLKGIPKAEANVVEDLLNNSGVGKNINFLGIGKGSGRPDNAHYIDVKPYIDDKGNKIIGNVDVSHENMYKPGIIAHELGHANISKNKGIVGGMQKHLYPLTHKFSPLLGTVSGLGIYGATKDDTNVATGAAKGLGIASLLNAGILVPEFEASRRGAVNIMRSSLPGHLKAKNIASMLPAFLTYLTATGGVGAGIGGINAYYNKKRKAKKGKKEKQGMLDMSGLLKDSGAKLASSYYRNLRYKNPELHRAASSKGGLVRAARAKREAERLAHVANRDSRLEKLKNPPQLSFGLDDPIKTADAQDKQDGEYTLGERAKNLAPVGI